MGIWTIAGSMYGMKQAKKYEARADEATAKAMQELRNVGIPDVEAQKIVLQNPQLVYQFDPELEDVIGLEPTGLADVVVDDRLKEAQYGALDRMQQVGEEGLTDADRAELRELQRQTAAEAQAKDASIMQNLASRGQSGSGQELAQRLLSSQQSAQRSAEGGDRIAQMAFQRALEGIEKSGGLASQMRGQEYGEKSEAAKAQDLINQFNVQSRQGVQQRNIGAKNTAAQQRAQLEQNLENQRAATANQQETHNKDLMQQKYENELRKAAGVAGMYGQQAATQERRGAQRMAAYTGMGQSQDQTDNSLMSSAGSFAAMSDEKNKKDIRSGTKSIRKFLDEIVPKIYNYKDEKYGEGEYTGPTAQDLEKSKLGKDLVKDTPEGKIVDYGKALGTIVAAQSDIHKRLKKIEKKA